MVLAAVVPHAMETSRLLAVAEIHGAYVPQRMFAFAKGGLFQPLEWHGTSIQPCCHSFPKWHRGERKFISATEIRRSSDIAVVAQSKRNVVIPVALGAK
jgi:hypothetical protein